MPDIPHVPYTNGITLRDLFALAALTGIVADHSVTVAEAEEQEEVADWAYGLADAMIRRRTQQPEG